MLKGAAKTLTEMATHIHPRAWTLYGCLTANCVTRQIKENIPMFIRANSLMVNFCNQQFEHYIGSVYIVSLIVISH